VNDAPQTAAATPRQPGARHGFTLVELLVVILIIGMLAGLLTPAVMRALASARNAAIKAEIDMLHMAIMNYKNEYGSFPPCFDPMNYAAGSRASKHLSRIFPRCPNPTAVGPNAQFAGWDPLTPENSFIGWLNGYSSDPMQPITGAGGRKRLYDFDQARVAPNLIRPQFYHASGKPNARYEYIDNQNYDNAFFTPTQSQFTSPAPLPLFVHVYPDRVLTNGATRNVPPWVNSLPPARRELWFFTMSLDPAERPHQRRFNDETFQLFNAGRDEEFGTDDDLSNFWPGTRREYLDSLKN
jgi:prepilin-type N-terminal cleavage/methylation domain-containing protein